MEQTLDDETTAIVQKIEHDKEELEQAFGELRKMAIQTFAIQSYVKRAPFTWMALGFRVGFLLARLF